MTQPTAKLGFNGTWSMAVGGMIGGGIFSTLGVVVAIAGAWAWVSFLAAGLIALAAGYSYVKLALFYDEGGGAFTYLREVHADGFAGSLAWVLIIGYVLTNAVYAFTFGQYLGHLLELNSWFPRAAAIAIIGLFIALNLKGVAEASGVEIFLVWFKLVVLVGLSAWGLSHWDIPMLSQGVDVADAGLGAALFGAAAVFMAYEGFQLLTYAYKDIETPRKILPRAVLSAIIIVILVYILVALGTAMLIGADEIVKHEEVALAIAGEKAFGLTGLIIVTIAAAFSTGSAINATLFATARLAHKVATAHELPAAIAHTNTAGIPDRAVIWLGGTAALLAAIGNLTSLVEAASLAFLFTFTVVCGLAFKQQAGSRWITGFGVLSAVAASIALIVQLFQANLPALLFLMALIGIAVFARPSILRFLKNSRF